MFKRFLVPLDGSRLAEAVLPAATVLAERFQATVILFHAIEQDAPATVHGERHLFAADQAATYLDQVAARLAEQGVSVEKNVHPVLEARVARSILEHADELNADLILLCAHGRGGWRDVLVGSIAQQVIQRGTTPVFFIRPKAEDVERPFRCRKILLPLDSKATHEPALPVAAAIAEKCEAGLHLLTVVPTASTLSAERAATGMLLPTTMTAVLELAQRGAVEYLQNVSARMLAEGVPTAATVARGDPPTMILSTAKNKPRTSSSWRRTAAAISMRFGRGVSHPKSCRKRTCQSCSYA